MGGFFFLGWVGGGLCYFSACYALGLGFGMGLGLGLGLGLGNINLFTQKH